MADIYVCARQLLSHSNLALLQHGKIRSDLNINAVMVLPLYDEFLKEDLTSLTLTTYSHFITGTRGNDAVRNFLRSSNAPLGRARLTSLK